MVYLDEVVAASNNIPLGHSGSGLALRLDTADQVTGPASAPTALDPAVPKILWEDSTAHGILTISTGDTPISVVWGNTSGDANAQPSHRWYAPKNLSYAWRVSDADGTDYIKVATTTSSEALYLANATTNPDLVFLGSGGWSVGGGYGSSGQALVSNGSSAAPTWQTIATTGITGTTSTTFDINNGATGGSASSGALLLWSGSGSSHLYKTSLTETNANLIISTTDNGAATSPTLILGLNSGSAASQSALTWSAASASVQRTISATWVASTQELTFSGGTVSMPGAGSASERFGSGAAAGGANSTALGGAASSAGTYSLAGGYQASASATNSTALGAGALASGANATALGYQAYALTTAYAIAIGSGARSDVASIVIGGTEVSTAGRFLVGGTNIPIDTMIIGKGNTSATPADNTWRITDASGTNTSGANLTIRTGLGTGTGSSGYLALVVGVAGASGSTANTATVVLKADGAAAGGRLGFFGTTPAAQQTVGALTNNVTSGGTNGTLDNWTDLTLYMNDAAAIRNAIYQLGRTVAQLTTTVRALGLGA